MERAAELKQKVKEDTERADAIAKIEEDKKLRASEMDRQADEWQARGKSFADAARSQVLYVPLGSIDRGKSGCCTCAGSRPRSRNRVEELVGMLPPS
jgi:hypothetical protein